MSRIHLSVISDSLVAAAQAVVGASIPVYGPDQLAINKDNLGSAAVGVSYLGRARQASTEPNKRGLATNTRWALHVFEGTVPCAGVEGAPAIASALETLDQLKDALVDKESPTGHPWIFISDMPFTFKQQSGAALMGYVQVWETAQV